MTKDELICNLKNHKENLASLKLKRKSLKKKEKKLKILQSETRETNITSSTGVNNDIKSQNKIGNKVEIAVINKLTEIEELKKEISDLKKDIFILTEYTEDTKIRLEALNFKEYKFVEAYFFQGRIYEEIGNILYFELFKQTRSEDSVKRTIDNAIKKMIKL